MRLSIEYEGEDAGTAGVRTTDCMAAGAGRLCADVSTQVEVIIIKAGSIAGFPLLKAFFSTHVDSLILCAEVGAGKGGGAVVVAETKVCYRTRTVNLGGTYFAKTWDVHT